MSSLEGAVVKMERAETTNERRAADPGGPPCLNVTVTLLCVGSEKVEQAALLSAQSEQRPVCLRKRGFICPHGVFPNV